MAISHNNDSRRTRSTFTWVVGIAFLLILGWGFFFYDGRGSNTRPGPHEPNVVNNPTGSK